MDCGELVDKVGLAHAIETCQIRVDIDGDWYYEGNKLIREDILELFYEHLELTQAGDYVMSMRQSRCVLDVEDTPFVVYRVDQEHARQSGQEQILLRMKHVPQPEVLDPSRLYVGKDNVLYCKVYAGRFPARFARPAYYQIAQWIEETPDGAGFCLILNNQRYPIQLPGD